MLVIADEGNQNSTFHSLRKVSVRQRLVESWIAIPSASVHITIVIPDGKRKTLFLRLIRLFRERRPFGIINTFYDCLSLTFWKVKENEIAWKNKEFLTTTRARLAIFFIAAAQFAFNPFGTIYGNLKLMLCRINKILFIAPIGLIGPPNGGGRKKTFSSSETEFISLCVQMCVKWKLPTTRETARLNIIIINCEEICYTF